MIEDNINEELINEEIETEVSEEPENEVSVEETEIPTEEPENDAIEPSVEPVPSLPEENKFYYGYITDGWGFIDSSDSRKDELTGLIELSEEEHQDLLDKQSEGLEIVCYDGEVFCAEYGTYYVDENNEWQKRNEEEIDKQKLEKAKELKITENDRVRDEVLNSGVTYKNVLFDSDTDQKVNLLATVGMMSDNDTIMWFGKDNQPLECEKEDLINIGGLITQLHSFCWNKNAEIKLLISEAETVEDVENIEIDYKL